MNTFAVLRLLATDDRDKNTEILLLCHQVAVLERRRSVSIQPAGGGCRCHYKLRPRADPARVYEIVLQEGTPADILSYVDGALLIDLWDELVLPRAVRAAWAPLVTRSSGKAA